MMKKDKMSPLCSPQYEKREEEEEDDKEEGVESKPLPKTNTQDPQSKEGEQDKSEATVRELSSTVP